MNKNLLIVIVIVSVIVVAYFVHSYLEVQNNKELKLFAQDMKVAQKIASDQQVSNGSTPSRVTGDKATDVNTLLKDSVNLYSMFKQVILGKGDE